MLILEFEELIINNFHKTYEIYFEFQRKFDLGMRFDNCIIIYISKDKKRKEEFNYYSFAELSLEKNIKYNEHEYRQKL